MGKSIGQLFQMKFLFYRPLKLTAEESKVCFWSDTHFGHRCDSWENPLWKARGFSSIQEHDEVLMQRWNELSTPETIFFHLGDFIFGFDTVERFQIILKRLTFKVLYILPGNHNSGWKQNFENQAKNTLYLEENKKVVFVPNYIETVVNNQPIALSHYPLASHNGQAKGSWMLHGHCHGNLYKSEIGPILYKAKIMDVGVENCPYPLTFKELNHHFKSKPNVTFDHHDQNTRNPF